MTGGVYAPRAAPPTMSRTTRSKPGPAPPRWLPPRSSCTTRRWLHGRWPFLCSWKYHRPGGAFGGQGRGTRKGSRHEIANVLGAWLVGMVLGANLAAAQGTVETQKGPPPAPNTLAPESTPPRTAPERPAIEPKPGMPALAPVPGSVDEDGRPVPGDRRILGVRVPVLLTGLGVLIVLLLTTGAMRRRSRADRTAPVPRGPR